MPINVSTDLFDLAVAMRRCDATINPDEANDLLLVGSQAIDRFRELARTIARPWIDGGVTAKEWCEAVDEVMGRPIG